MKSSSVVTRLLAWTALLPIFALGMATPALAHDTGMQHVHFQKPKLAAENERVAFRSSSKATASRRTAKNKRQASSALSAANANNAEQATYLRSSGNNPLRARPLPKLAKSAARTPKVAHRGETASKTRVKHVAKKLSRSHKTRRDEQVLPAAHGRVIYESQVQEACAMCGTIDGSGCEPDCGIAEPGCGIIDAGCGIADPGYAIVDPGYAIADPDCGLVEPDCGIVDECGSYVAPPTPDYWCLPIYLPRFKTLTVWTGVHGFRGPRDFATSPTLGNRSDSNFGFQEGINIGGRAPLIGLRLPQISYQLGYQALQSRLSGTANDTDDRSQQFVTAGLFRRVSSGLQFGVVWDLMADDLDINADFQQIRTEISIKSARGREIGFTSATHTNDSVVNGVTYQAVDQYLAFFRWHFHRGGQGRFWGGATNDSEGIFGADFQVPINDRWSLQTGFNYLITSQSSGLNGVSEESWNVGMNLVWHLGRRARQTAFQPLFSVADNGWMFIDRKP